MCRQGGLPGGGGGGGADTYLFTGDARNASATVAAYDRRKIASPQVSDQIVLKLTACVSHIQTARRLYGSAGTTGDDLLQA